MENVILIFVIVTILTLAIWYIVKAKKKGQRCIGCPSGGCKNCPGCQYENKE